MFNFKQLTEWASGKSSRSQGRSMAEFNKINNYPWQQESNPGSYETAMSF